MNKERRLGRGLEALLGGLPGWNNAAAEAGRRHAVGGDAGGGRRTRPAPLGRPRRHPAPSIGQAMARGVPAEPPAPAGDRLRQRPQLRRPAAVLAAAGDRSDRQQSGPTPAGLQPRGVADPGREHPRARAVATGGGAASGGSLRAGRRRAAVAGGQAGRLDRRAGQRHRGRRPADGRAWRSSKTSIARTSTPLEKAASFQRYLEQYGCTQEELAGRLKLDRSTIANLIRLLELPEAVQEAIRQGKITQGHARALLPLGDEREQIAFCERIQKEGLNVRQTEEMVQEMIHAGRPRAAGRDRPRRPAVADAQRAERESGGPGAAASRGLGHAGEDHPRRQRTWQVGDSFSEPRGF